MRKQRACGEVVANGNGKSNTTATSNSQGITSDPLTLKLKKEVWQPSRVPDESLVCFCLLSRDVLLYVVMRFAASISSLEEMRTRSQASSVIPWCPVTAVSSIRACGCRYPILHLCHSAPTDQQSNFTQARSEGGNADTGMRIYASTKTSSCLKWLEGWWSKRAGAGGVLKN